MNNGKYRSENDLKISKYLKEENYPDEYDEEEREELRKHRLIKLSFKDSVLLFLHNNILCFRCCPWWKK